MTDYLVVIENEGSSWGAYRPDLPGVGVVGRSRSEVEDLIETAVNFHIEGLRDAGDEVPKPSASATTTVTVHSRA